MFDSNAEFRAFIRTAQGKVEIRMRCPTDEEFGRWWRDRKVIVRSLGRGRTERNFEIGTTGLRLYEAIKTPESPTLTEAEAEVAANHVAMCDVRACDLGVTDAEVTLVVPGGEVKHTLRIPTADEVKKWRKAAGRARDLPGNASEMISSIEPGAALYDACSGTSADYTGAIPAYHKDQVLRAVLEAVDMELAAGGDEANSF